MNLTAAQRKRLAREARKLAMECVEGTAPGFGNHGYDDCALTHLGIRYGMKGFEIGNTFCGRPLFDDWWLVATANDRATPGTRHAAVVFPLLALADALDPTP